MGSKLIFVFLSTFTYVYAVEYMIDLKFAGMGLKQMDNIPPSQSDPYLDIFTQMNPSEPPRKVGTTVFIPNNNNPTWPETWRFFYTENVSQQSLSIKVMDDDGALPNELIGEVYFTIQNLFEAENHVLFVPLTPDGQGVLRVNAQVSEA